MINYDNFWILIRTQKREKMAVGRKSRRNLDSSNLAWRFAKSIVGTWSSDAFEKVVSAVQVTWITLYKVPVRLVLTLSERMPPYSRHHIDSKRIECRHRGGKNKNNSRLLLELKIKIPDICSNCKSKFPTFARIKTQKLTNFIRIATQVLPST